MNLSPPRHPTRVVRWLALAAGLGASPPALGAPAAEPTAGDAAASPSPSPSDSTDARRERARRAYERGEAAFAGGRYLEAVHWFQEADTEAPDGRLSYNIALAYESMGSASEALRWYREYLRRVPTAEDRTEVQASVARLEYQLASYGVQQVTVLSRPAGAVVHFDGRPVGVTPWTGLSAPGRHRVEVSLPGHEPAATDFELSAANALDVTLNLPKVRDDDDANGASPATSHGGRVSTVTWLTLGVGTAALTAAGVFEWSRAAAEDDARAAHSQLDAQQQYDRMSSDQTLSRWSLGIGAAAVLVGGYLLWNDLSSPSEAPVSAGCGPGSCGLLARGRF